MADNGPADHISISPVVFYLLLGSAATAGVGGGTFLQPAVNQEALEACFDNSQRAINVAVQHGEELNNLRQYIDTRTQDRYTAQDAGRDWRNQDRRDAEQDRRLNLLDETHPPPELLNRMGSLEGRLDRLEREQ